MRESKSDRRLILSLLPQNKEFFQEHENGETNGEFNL